MANQFLDAQVYANTMLHLAKNALVTGRLVDGEFKDQVTNENGLKISVKRPPRFIDKKNGTAALAAQDIVTGSVDVAVDQYSKVHINVGDIEYVESYNELMRKQSMLSAASTLAHSIDSYLQDKTLRFHSWVAGAATGGANATDPAKNIASSVQAMAAHTRLMEMGTPNASLSGTVQFRDGELIRGSLLSSQTQSINISALEKTRIPVISEVDWYATQQIPSLTTGDRPDSTGEIAGNDQNKNYRDVKNTMTQELDLDTLGNSKWIRKGEVFTIANVKAWDWRKGVALDYLQQFTVVSDVQSHPSAGTATVTISPPIIVQGTSDGTNTDANTAFATVDAKPIDGAAITFVGSASTTYRVRSAWHKSAIKLVSARLAMPFTGDASFAVDKETGIAIRYWRGSDISTGAHIHRWDAIYGAEVADPFLGTRICGT